MQAPKWLPIFCAVTLAIGASTLGAAALVGSNDMEPQVSWFWGTTPNNQTYIGLHVWAADGVELRIPRFGYISCCSESESGACNLNAPEAILYVLSRDDTARVVAGGQPADPLFKERAGDQAHAYCGEGGFPAAVHVPVEASDISFAQYETARSPEGAIVWSNGTVTPWRIWLVGVDAIIVFPGEVPTYKEVGASSLIITNGTGEQAAEAWADQVRADGAVLASKDLKTEAVLRTFSLVALGGALVAAVAMLVAKPGPGPRTGRVEAAVDLIEAGEQMLMRLRRVWWLVGALLMACFALYAGFVANVVLKVGDSALPVQGWATWIFLSCGVLLAALAVLWSAELRRQRVELANWRAAEQHLPGSLDDL